MYLKANCKRIVVCIHHGLGEHFDMGMVVTSCRCIRNSENAVRALQTNQPVRNSCLLQRSAWANQNLLPSWLKGALLDSYITDVFKIKSCTLLQDMKWGLSASIMVLLHMSFALLCYKHQHGY